MDPMDRRAMRALKQDLHGIYDTCGQEVTLRDEHGVEKAYWPKRYLQGLRRAERLGDSEVIAYVERIVTRPRPTKGFSRLAACRRPDLTVEWLVADGRRPYHRFFAAGSVLVARERLTA
jgi:hypothetical protein